MLGQHKLRSSSKAIMDFEYELRGSIHEYWKMVERYKTDTASVRWGELVQAANNIVYNISLLKHHSEQYIIENPHDKRFLKFYSHILLFYTADVHKAESAFTLATTKNDGVLPEFSEATDFWNQKTTLREIIPLVDHGIGNDNVYRATNAWVLRHVLSGFCLVVLVLFLLLVSFLCVSPQTITHGDEILLWSEYLHKSTELTSTVRSIQLAADGMWDTVSHDPGQESAWFNGYKTLLRATHSDLDSLTDTVNDNAMLSAGMDRVRENVSGKKTSYIHFASTNICPGPIKAFDPFDFIMDECDLSQILLQTPASLYVCESSETCSINLVNILANAGLSFGRYLNESQPGNDGKNVVNLIELPCYSGNTTSTIGSATSYVYNSNAVTFVETFYEVCEIVGSFVLLLILVVFVPLVLYVRKEIYRYKEYTKAFIAGMDPLFIYSNIVSGARAMAYGKMGAGEHGNTLTEIGKEKIKKEYERLADKKTGQESSSVTVECVNGLGQSTSLIQTQVRESKNTEEETHENLEDEQNESTSYMTETYSHDDKEELLKPSPHIRKMSELDTSLCINTRHDKKFLKLKTHYKLLHWGAIILLILVPFLALTILVLMFVFHKNERILYDDIYRAAALPTLVAEINYMVRELSYGMKLYPPRQPYPKGCDWNPDNNEQESFDYTCASMIGQFSEMNAQISHELDYLDKIYKETNKHTFGNEKLDTLYKNASCFRLGKDLMTDGDECHGRYAYSSHDSLYPQAVWPKDVYGIDIVGLDNMVDYYIGMASVFSQCMSLMNNIKGPSESYAALLSHEDQVRKVLSYLNVDVQEECSLINLVNSICEEIVDPNERECEINTAVETDTHTYVGVCNHLFAFIWDIGGNDIIQGLQQAVSLRASLDETAGDTVISQMQESQQTAMIIITVLSLVLFCLALVTILFESRYQSLTVERETCILQLVSRKYISDVQKEVAFLPNSERRNCSCRRQRTTIGGLLETARRFGFHVDLDDSDSTRLREARIDAADTRYYMGDPATSERNTMLLQEFRRAVGNNYAMDLTPNDIARLANLLRMLGDGGAYQNEPVNNFSETPVPGMHLNDIVLENTLSNSPGAHIQTTSQRKRSIGLSEPNISDLIRRQSQAPRPRPSWSASYAQM